MEDKDVRAMRMKELYDKGMTYGQIGKVFFLTRQRVEQILARYGKPKGSVWCNNNWQQKVKTLVLDRDKCCQKCGTTDHLLIHHIDKDKTNNRLENLITLCSRCHLALHRPVANPKPPKPPKSPKPRREPKERVVIRNGKCPECEWHAGRYRATWNNFICGHCGHIWEVTK